MARRKNLPTKLDGILVVRNGKAAEKRGIPDERQARPDDEELDNQGLQLRSTARIDSSDDASKNSCEQVAIAQSQKYRSRDEEEDVAHPQH